MYINDIEIKLSKVFDEFTSFYIPKKYKKQFKQDAYIAGGCIYSLANDQEPKDYDFFITDRNLVKELMNEFRNMTDICVMSDNAVTFCDGRYQIITRYIGDPASVVGEFDFKHNMFYYHCGKVTGLVPESYLKTKRLVFNAARARDIAGVLLRIPRFITRGMTITNTELASIISKLCYNFDDNEKCILNDKSTYDGKKLSSDEDTVVLRPGEPPIPMSQMPRPQLQMPQQQRFNLPF